MPYALFADHVKVSSAFATKAEVWKHASDSGLVEEVASTEEDPPLRNLNAGFTIKECAVDLSIATATKAMGKTGLQQTMQPASVNPRWVAASS